VGGLQREVGGLQREVGGLQREVGGLQREVGGLPYRKTLPVKYFLCKKKHRTTDVEQIGWYDLISDTDSVCSS
jgi:hypothetical protein